MAEDNSTDFDEFEEEEFILPKDLEVAGFLAPIEAVKKPLPKSRYGAIAYDLVLQVAPIEDICKAHDIDEEQLQALLEIPAFKQAIRAAHAKVKELGEGSGFALRAQALSEDLLGEIYLMAKGSAPVSPETKLKIFESLVRYGRLDPAVENKGKDKGSGVKVIINLPSGVRGLEHLTIDAEEIEE